MLVKALCEILTVALKTIILIWIVVSVSIGSVKIASEYEEVFHKEDPVVNGNVGLGEPTFVYTKSDCDVFCHKTQQECVEVINRTICVCAWPLI